MNKSGRQYGANATVLDLTRLLERLSNQYASGPGQVSDLNLMATEDLIEVFATMEEYYSFGAGKEVPQA